MGNTCAKDANTTGDRRDCSREGTSSNMKRGERRKDPLSAYAIPRRKQQDSPAAGGFLCEDAGESGNSKRAERNHEKLRGLFDASTATQHRHKRTGIATSRDTAAMSAPGESDSKKIQTPNSLHVAGGSLLVPLSSSIASNHAGPAGLNNQREESGASKGTTQRGHSNCGNSNPHSIDSLVVPPSTTSSFRVVSPSVAVKAKMIQDNARINSKGSNNKDHFLSSVVVLQQTSPRPSATDAPTTTTTTTNSPTTANPSVDSAPPTQTNTRHFPPHQQQTQPVGEETSASSSLPTVGSPSKRMVSEARKFHQHDHHCDPSRKENEKSLLDVKTIKRDVTEREAASERSANKGDADDNSTSSFAAILSKKKNNSSFISASAGHNSPTTTTTTITAYIRDSNLPSIFMYPNFTTFNIGDYKNPSTSVRLEPAWATQRSYPKKEGAVVVVEGDESIFLCNLVPQRGLDNRRGRLDDNTSRSTSTRSGSAGGGGGDTVTNGNISDIGLSASPTECGGAAARINTIQLHPPPCTDGGLSSVVEYDYCKFSPFHYNAHAVNVANLNGQATTNTVNFGGVTVLTSPASEGGGDL